MLSEVHLIYQYRMRTPDLRFKKIHFKKTRRIRIFMSDVPQKMVHSEQFNLKIEIIFNDKDYYYKVNDTLSYQMHFSNFFFFICCFFLGGGGGVHIWINSFYFIFPGIFIYFEKINVLYFTIGTATKLYFS